MFGVAGLVVGNWWAALPHFSGMLVSDNVFSSAYILEGFNS
jgi:hypothetical protein